jgi:Flp pilus assembly protein TadD
MPTVIRVLRPFAAIGLSLLLAATLTGCGSEPGEPADADADHDHDHGEPGVGVPYPDLSALDDTARGAVEREREELEAVLADERATDDQRAAAFAEAGMMYHAYGLHGAAEAAYFNVRGLQPDDYRWPYYLGKLYGQYERPDNAVVAYIEALELKPSYLPAMIEVAEIELGRQRLDNAEAVLIRAKQLAPDNASVLYALGRVAFGRRDFKTAVDYFEAALRRAPEADAINYPLGLAYRGLGDEETAVKFIEKRGNREPTLADPLMDELNDLATGWRVHQNRATHLFEAGQLEEALVEYRKAADLAPTEPVVHNNLGTILTRLGRVADADAEYREALRLDPGNAMAHFNLGTLAAARGRDREAVEHYRSALNADPAHELARFNLANALRRSGELEAAIEEYAWVVQRDGSNVDARLGEALSLIRLERYAEAARRLEAGTQAMPDDRRLRHALVRVLAAAPDNDVRDGALAVELGTTLLEASRSLDHVEAFAMAAAETGQMELAVNWQQAAIRAANQAGRADLLPGLEKNLRLYQAGQPCREPWPLDGPVLSPRSAAPGSVSDASARPASTVARSN